VSSFGSAKMLHGRETLESPLPLLAARSGMQQGTVSSLRGAADDDDDDEYPSRSPRPPLVDMNRRIAQDILQKQQQQQKQKQRGQQGPVEADPQEAPPGWYDFAVAVFFILFGVLALFAGIFSLFMETGAEAAKAEHAMDKTN